MTKCFFCGREQESFRGLHFIKNDGSVDYFCSSKCRKNALHLKRDKRKMRWAEAFHETRAKAAKRAEEKSLRETEIIKEKQEKDKLKAEKKKRVKANKEAKKVKKSVKKKE